MAQIEGKFYPLQHDEWVKFSKLLTNSELRVLYYLRTLDPFGDRYQEASTKAIAEILDISQRTVQRAVFKLAELELIDLEITRFNFQVRSLHALPQKADKTGEAEVKERLRIATPMSPSDTHVAPTTFMSRQRHSCRANDIHVAPTTSMSRSTAETQSQSESCISKTIKTYTDFIKTLSEGERENFLNFVKEQIKNLPKQVNDLEAWLANQNQAGQNRWEVYYNNFLASQKVKNESVSKYQSLSEEIEQHRQKIKKKLREQKRNASEMSEPTATKEERHE
jgi:DNA-binding MarR family transcriptional regulator